jgi:ADP-ribose pyrophosphatase YjhB (NUDIX family)
MKRVVVAFIFNNNKLLLIKHKKKNMWLPVGGHIEGRETDLEALKREVKEETNLDITDIKLFHTLEEPNEITPHFICTSKTRDVKIQESEILDFVWFSEKEIKQVKQLDKNVKEISLLAFNSKKIS